MIISIYNIKKNILLQIIDLKKSQYPNKKIFKKCPN